MYIINLDPSNNTYLVSCEMRCDNLLSPLPSTWVTSSTQDKSKAKRYVSYNDAQLDASNLRGWGGCQRVEEMRVNIDFDHTSDGFGEFE